jgi:hypothetical protein
MPSTDRTNSQRRGTKRWLTAVALAAACWLATLAWSAELGLAAPALNSIALLGIGFAAGSLAARSVPGK